MTYQTFKDFNLNDWLVRQCATIGVVVPTPVQSACIPKILNGHDCVGASKTGTGKTLAFALPILQKLCEGPYGIFALVLTATRELAHQIADQFAVIGKAMNLRHCVVVGGVDMIEQGLQLSRRPHIVIATPGRLADHLESCKTFSFDKIKFLVLDEADRLLGGDFNNQIKTIFKHLPKERQNLFFSATITDTLKILQKAIRKDVFYYEASDSNIATVEQLEQRYVLCPGDVKDGYLVQVIREFRETDEKGNIMIFTDTCKRCQVLYLMLNDVGFDSVALHSMMPQKQRLAALAKFKNNTVKILVATDVASRGLDIPTVQLVLNHILPKVPKEYIHRVGRTARAGRGGKAVSLVTPYDIALLKAIEKLIKTEMTELKVNDSEVGKIFTQVSVAKSEAHINLDETDFFEKTLINKRKKWIMEGLDPDEEQKKMLNKGKKRKKGKKDENQLDTPNTSDSQIQTTKSASTSLKIS